MEMGLFSQVLSEKTRRNDLKLCQGSVGWLLGRNSSPKGL